MNFVTVNILDAIENYGEDKVKNILSNFSCEKNKDVEGFIRNKAINFAKQKISMTYLILNEAGKVVGFFTLAHKPLIVENEGALQLSNTQRKRLAKHSKLDELSGSYELSAFLIAQFGKNDAIRSDLSISGSSLMKIAIDTLTIAQHIIGGGVIFLECENKEKLLTFYQNQENGFKRYGSRLSSLDNKNYIRLLRFF